ncbi:MAG: hypothetical protein AB1551_01570 [Actinomycetota bacterium]
MERNPRRREYASVRGFEMHPMAVIGFSLGIGAIVFAVSYWGGEETLAFLPRHGAAGGEKTGSTTPFLGFGTPRARQPSPTDEGADRGDSFTYVPVIADVLTWRTRVTAVVGLILVVGLAALLLALGFYQAGHLLNETLAKFLEK